MNELFKRVFSRDERERCTASIHAFCGWEELQYVRALEDVAKAAVDYSTNSTPVNAIKLNDALAVVDRMRQ